MCVCHEDEIAAASVNEANGNNTPLVEEHSYASCPGERDLVDITDGGKFFIFEPVHSHAHSS
jgi:hypothetical protein